MVNKGVIIIGAGPGLGLALAKKFGKEGFSVGLISRSEEKLSTYVAELASEGIKSYFATANASSKQELSAAIDELKPKIGGIETLIYNAVSFNLKPLFEVSADELEKDYVIGVSNAYYSVEYVLDDLIENKGSILLTGGILGTHPDPNFCSVSLAKAGIRNLALQLNKALSKHNVYVGTLTIQGFITPESEKHNPTNLAEEFHEMNVSRKEAEKRV